MSGGFVESEIYEQEMRLCGIDPEPQWDSREEKEKTIIEIDCPHCGKKITNVSMETIKVFRVYRKDERKVLTSDLSTWSARCDKCQSFISLERNNNNLKIN